MAITVDIDLGYEFNVKAPFKEVFDLLSDVPTSVGFFPKVQRLSDLGGGIYRWEMEKVGTAQAHIRPSTPASTLATGRRAAWCGRR